MTMQGPNNNPRLRGVMGNAGPTATTGTPRTVAAVVPLEQFAVHYYDENGTPRTNVLIKVGEKYYFAPNGIEWAASLKPAAEWVKKGVLAVIGNKEPAAPAEPLPKEDPVDVMGDNASGDNDGNSPQE